MRLIQQYALRFTTPSNKIKLFEIDLCEVGDKQYVVNFRYGRKGHPLREGTRTREPLPMANAMQEMAKLIERKVDSGYQIVDQFPDQFPISAPPLNLPNQTTPQKPNKSAQKATRRAKKSTSSPTSTSQHVLNPVWLGTGRTNSYEADNLGNTSDFSDSHLSAPQVIAKVQAMVEDRLPRSVRVFWRVGELRLEECVDALVSFLGHSDGEDYALVWALGRCGGAQVVSVLSEQIGHRSPSVSRIARAGLARLDKQFREGLRFHRGSHQEPLQGQALARSLLVTPGLTRGSLADVYLSGDQAAFEHLFQSINLNTREGLGCARTVYQLAEFWDDVLWMSRVAARFESALLATTAGGRRRLRSRVWRTFERMRRDRDPRVFSLAEALSLAFNDEEHPHAAQHERKLFQEIQDAFSDLTLSRAQALALATRSQCSPIVDIFLAKLASVGVILDEDDGVETLGALLQGHSNARALGLQEIASLDAKKVHAWVISDPESLLNQPALVGELVAHADEAVRQQARLLMGQSDVSEQEAQLVEATLRACASPDRGLSAQRFALQTLWLSCPGVLHDLSIGRLVSLLRLGGGPLTDFAAVLLKDRSGIPANAALPLLTSQSEAGVLLGLSVLEGLSDAGLLWHHPEPEQRVLRAQLIVLCRAPGLDLRRRAAVVLTRLLLESGELLTAGENRPQH